MPLRRCTVWNAVKCMESVNVTKSRTFKNFGHKREPIPAVTTLWHGFLTFSFIGMGMNWDTIANFIFGAANYDQMLQDSLTSQEESKSQ